MTNEGNIYFPFVQDALMNAETACAYKRGNGNARQIPKINCIFKGALAKINKNFNVACYHHVSSLPHSLFYYENPITSTL